MCDNTSLIHLCKVFLVENIVFCKILRFFSNSISVGWQNSDRPFDLFLLITFDYLNILEILLLINIDMNVINNHARNEKYCIHS